MESTPTPPKTKNFSILICQFDYDHPSFKERGLAPLTQTINDFNAMKKMVKNSNFGDENMTVSLNDNKADLQEKLNNALVEMQVQKKLGYHVKLFMHTTGHGFQDKDDKFNHLHLMHIVPGESTNIDYWQEKFGKKSNIQVFALNDMCRSMKSLKGNGDELPVKQ